MIRRSSRRALFGSAALLATLPSFARANGPDRELVAVCGAFIAACDQYDAAWSRERSDAEAKAEGDSIMTVQGRQLDRMGELRAMTAEGIQARALALSRFYRPETMGLGGGGTWPDRLLTYLLRDTAALGGVL